MKDPAKFLEEAVFPTLKTLWPQVFGHVAVVHAGKWMAVYVYVKDPSFLGSLFSSVVRKVDELVNATRFSGRICRFEGSIVRLAEGGFRFCYQFWVPIDPNIDVDEFKRRFFPVSSENGLL